MKKSIPTLTAVAAALAPVTVAGCTPAAPSPTPPAAFSTLPAPGGSSKIMPTAWAAITNAKKFGATAIDEAAAGNALESGRPVLVALPDGDNPLCHAALLVPGDEKPWILNSSSISTAGTAMERTLLQYGCGAGMEIPTPRVPVPVPVLPLDQPAARAAMAAKVPYIYGLPSGPTADCHTAVMLPGEVRWVLNRSGGPTVAGDALDRNFKEYACTAVAMPGDPATSGGAR